MKYLQRFVESWEESYALHTQRKEKIFADLKTINDFYESLSKPAYAIGVMVANENERLEAELNHAHDLAMEACVALMCYEFLPISEVVRFTSSNGLEEGKVVRLDFSEIIIDVDGVHKPYRYNDFWALGWEHDPSPPGKTVREQLQVKKRNEAN